MNRWIGAYVAFSLLLTLQMGSASAQENTGILYGDGHTYSLSAPKGWVLDNASGVDQGLHAVFYPEGGSWDGSPVVMYTNVARLGIPDQGTLEEVIANDITSMREGAPLLKVEKLDAITTTAQERKAIVYRFSGDPNGNHEAVAYIGEVGIAVLIVMTARNKKLFQKNLKAFEELVKSYWWITTDVRFGR